MFWTNRSRSVLPQVETPDGTPPGYIPEAGYELAVVDCAADPFTELVLSWNADTPPGTAIRIEARLHYSPVDDQPEAGTWSAWRGLGHWGTTGPAATPLPRSGEAAPPDDPAVKVAIDTLRVGKGYEATAFQARVTLYGGAATPEVYLLAASTVHRRRPPASAEADPPLGRPVALPVPARSQLVEREEIAHDICSPTSVSMVLQFYGIDRPTEEVAQGVYDHGAEIYGNWPFNTAYAARHGLQAVVRHFGTLGEVERELHQGHPVIISVAFEPGELPEAPIPRTNGHLLVVTGVDAAGDFLVNDPAAHPHKGQAITRTYGRENLRRVFLGHGGVGYVLEPLPSTADTREVVPA
jgi:Peptidase_C39 like family